MISRVEPTVLYRLGSIGETCHLWCHLDVRRMVGL